MSSCHQHRNESLRWRYQLKTRSPCNTSTSPLLRTRRLWPIRRNHLRSVAPPNNTQLQNIILNQPLVNQQQSTAGKIGENLTLAVWKRVFCPLSTQLAEYVERSASTGWKLVARRTRNDHLKNGTQKRRLLDRYSTERQDSWPRTWLMTLLWTLYNLSESNEYNNVNKVSLRPSKVLLLVNHALQWYPKELDQRNIIRGVSHESISTEIYLTRHCTHSHWSHGKEMVTKHLIV